MSDFLINSNLIFSLVDSGAVVLIIVDYAKYFDSIKFNKKVFKGLNKKNVFIRNFLIKLFENKKKVCARNIIDLNSGVIKGTKYFQSVSYSKKFAVLTISKSRVGVDVEYIKKRYLIKNRDSLSFYRDWTYKEAYCKLKKKNMIDLWDKKILYDLPKKTKLFNGFILTVLSQRKFNLYTYKYF